MVVTYYYVTLFLISLTLSIVYSFISRKHFSIYITLLYVFIPIANLGYIFTSRATSDEAALIGVKVTYIGGCFMIPIIMLSVFNLCKITIPKWISALLFAISSLLYFCVLTIGNNDLFYKGCKFVIRNDAGYIIDKEYGIAHDLFNILLLLYFLVSLVVICYSFFVKLDVSSKLLFQLALPEFLCLFTFFIGKLVTNVVDFVPVSYIFAQIMYLIIIHRLCLYDITDTSIDSLVEAGNTGFVSFDFKCRFLGSNETANKIFPELKGLTVDEIITSKKLQGLFLPWIEKFKNDENDDKNYYKSGDKTYLVDVNHLYGGNQKRGYQLFITDDTANQNYIALLDNYNRDLQTQVEEKTANIVEMHDRLIVSLATMVESRDNSTGGHIKRTSDVVRMLMDEIMKDDSLGLSEEFCKNIIKAAPMHDLGKIAVDDAILRKPGRFEPEEFEKMKAHAAEGARIVHEVLEGTEDLDFHIIAENVAHYHHERWDGSGYPEGLKGEAIPIEARIMAIADVYDALVSKRVYKDAMSFENADKIIMESMGKHFDKKLEKYYVAARPAMESYYAGL